jgi:hypothetical protein
MSNTLVSRSEMYRMFVNGNPSSSDRRKLRKQLDRVIHLVPHSTYNGRALYDPTSVKRFIYVFACKLLDAVENMEVAE